MIPEHKVDEVRDAADIVDLISGYVALERAGRLFRGLCPFHAEKTPSFSVNPERRIFHCFGCGVGGNVFRFLMLHKGISFPEAVTELARRYGVDLPQDRESGPSRTSGDKTVLYQLTALAARFFQDELAGAEGFQARDYLRDRGMPPAILQEFGLGWAPDGWDHLARHLEQKGVPEQRMIQAGLVRPRPNGRGTYDTFRARVITPIMDLDGRPVAFGGRILVKDENQPKYLNSPESPIFRKGRLLYGFHTAREAIRTKKTVYVVEGYFDLLALAAAGLRQVAATLGTALTIDHLRLLKGSVDQTVLVFDADEAGRRAAARALPLFMTADMDAVVLRLPEGHDPDTFVREYGPRAFEEAAAGAVPLLDFYLDVLRRKHPDSLAGRSRMVQDALEVMGQVESPVRRELLRKAMADRLGVSEDALSRSLRRPVYQENDPEPRERTEEHAAHFEQDLVRTLLLHPEAAAQVFSHDLGPLFQDTRLKKVYEALSEGYRIHGIVATDRMEGLSPDQTDMVTRLAMGEDGLTEDTLAPAVQDAVERFFEREKRSRVVDLSRRIKEAQAAGDDALLFNLMKEKNRLLKSARLGTRGTPREELPDGHWQ